MQTKKDLSGSSRQTSVTESVPAGQGGPLSRRLLLGRMALAAPVAAISTGGVIATAEAAPIDPHPAWLAERNALVAWLNGPDSPVELNDDVPEFVRNIELETLIAETPVRTLDGLLAQLRLLEEGDAIDLAHDFLVENAATTLERLIRGARASAERLALEARA